MDNKIQKIVNRLDQKKKIKKKPKSTIIYFLIKQQCLPATTVTT